MSQSDLLILGDWGTSACRLYLCCWQNNTLTVKDRTQGQGIKNNQNPESSFFAMCQPWIDEHGKIPAFLIGTVGADIGWRLAPYVTCPTDQHQLLNEAVSFSARGIEVTILPGVSCENRHGLPDIMRGEETQIIGYLSQQSTDKNEQLICLPGTHTKWALINDGQISSFVTSPVGELFEVLSNHTVLLNPLEKETWCEPSFSRGIDVGLDNTSNLLHTLFATRAFQVLLEQSNTQAGSYLSGLLVGADVKAAMQDFHLFSHVTLIGSEKMSALYAAALAKIDVASTQYSSEWSTINGLQSLASKLWQRNG